MFQETNRGRPKYTVQSTTMTLQQANEQWEAKALWEEQKGGNSKLPLKAKGGGHGGNSYSGTSISSIVHPAIVPDDYLERVNKEILKRTLKNISNGNNT